VLTAAGRDAQRPARWAMHGAWAPTEMPAGVNAEAEHARTRRPAADAATARMPVNCGLAPRLCRRWMLLQDCAAARGDFCACAQLSCTIRASFP
jgi:hypothetical protein